jgi:putative ABC transport system substrate-binding protein
MKKTFAIMTVLALLACAAVPALAEDKTMGVIQFAPHPSLDNCYEGFLDVVGQLEGVRIDFQNAAADMSIGDLQAKTMVSGGASMLVGIATPAAMSCYAAARDSGVPVVFIAVSDPVAAGIVSSIEAPGGNCTGVSDVLNFPAQLELIRAFLPDAAKIGVIYTTSEPNSVSHLAAFEAIAPEYGFAVEAMGITGAAEVGAAAAALIAKGVDCINNFTDNNVVNNLPMVLNAANEAGIPVFGSEVEQVVNGCLAAQGIDYVAVGRVAGEMAKAILSGDSDPATMAVIETSDVTPTYNGKVLEALSLTLPAAFAGIEDVG